MRIILIEDERQLAQILKKGLEEAGYSVDTAYDGEEGLYMLENIPADAAVLDIMLPKMDGLTVLNRVRKKGVQTPVILLTAKDTISDKIKGLDAGADDYLAKPFDFGELLARIRSLLRRKAEVKEAVIRIADLEINTASHEVKRGNRIIPLSAREYVILEYLAYRKGNVISRTEITEHIYDEEFDLDSNVVDVYINYLRNKIDKGFRRKLIHTVRGAGYMLKEE
ncbi:MAG: DNA-binding response regulator [Deltaproteobacteria bacterium RIFCSPLOWO2_02_44_9]|nr:MAG: DNA-binding response regulator [Deltaproteobacteria bacterium RIFCSPLOWO2_02_44_9]